MHESRFAGEIIMKRAITISVTLALCMAILSITSSHASAQVQQRRRFTIDTGVLTLAPNRTMIVTLAGDFNDDGALDDSDFLRARFTRMEFIEQGSIYRISAQSTLAPVTLGSGQGATFDVVAAAAPTTRHVRGFLSGVYVGASHNKIFADVLVTNVLTGETTSHIIMANTEGDFH